MAAVAAFVPAREIVLTEQIHLHGLTDHTVSGLCIRRCNLCRRGIVNKQKFLGCGPCRFRVCMKCVNEKYPDINAVAFKYSPDCKEFISLEFFEALLEDFEQEFSQDIEYVFDIHNYIEEVKIALDNATREYLDEERHTLETKLQELVAERNKMLETVEPFYFFRQLYCERNLKENPDVNGESEGVQFKYGMKIGGETITIYSSEATLHTYACCDVSYLPTFVRNDDNKRVEIKLQVGDSIVYSRRDKGKCKGSGYNGEKRLGIRSVPYYFL